MHEAQRRLGDRDRRTPRPNYDALDGRRRAGRRDRLERVPPPGLRRASRQRCRRRSSSTAATSTTRAKMRALGFTYDSIGRGAAHESPHHRRRRLPRLAPLRPVPARRARRRRARQLHHRAPGQHRAPRWATTRFEFIGTTSRRTRTSPARSTACCTSRRRRARSTTSSYPIADAQGRLARHAQRARPREGEGRALLPRLDVGGVRRSARASADGGVLGQREPRRPARCLRRGEALRRGDDDGVSSRTTASTRASSGSSTPTARACARATAASSRTSSSRR